MSNKNYCYILMSILIALMLVPIIYGNLYLVELLSSTAKYKTHIFLIFMALTIGIMCSIGGLLLESEKDIPPVRDQLTHRRQKIVDQVNSKSFNAALTHQKEENESPTYESKKPL